ncbi:MAG TPA: hypothetical protein P5538_02420 [Bacteroidales bacterium]|jgi:hypothetical protein|nr:hypothetical protein [Bacteroidales bacterium]HOL97969.1 hypothetical protein [Bacteroidales bacterium]HOM36356.1 hypothetical protein [Bacteroidales bacterium]HPD23523.1 hypothetical protein [Bacteroidales bacterium]HRS99171.1 hypothetical protein [Bacteroidales bacterium]
MKRFFLISILLWYTIAIFAQRGFVSYIEPSFKNIDVKYKITNQNFFDKSSPVVIILKLKNNNEFDVQVDIQIEYQFGIKSRYKSEKVSVCIPAGRIVGGRMHGLSFELKTSDTKIFNNEENEWFFSVFDVEQIDKCTVNRKNLKSN